MTPYIIEKAIGYWPLWVNFVKDFMQQKDRALIKGVSMSFYPNSLI
jgi:hypothetical protein